jgi:hypothetical protein
VISLFAIIDVQIKQFSSMNMIRPSLCASKVLMLCAAVNANSETCIVDNGTWTEYCMVNISLPWHAALDYCESTSRTLVIMDRCHHLQQAQSCIRVICTCLRYINLLTKFDSLLPFLNTLDVAFGQWTHYYCWLN